jgi:hypothetical protein
LLQLEWFVQQDLGLAADAFWMVIEAFGGDAVEAVAVGAGDEEWVGHDRAGSERLGNPKLIWSRNLRLSRQIFRSRTQTVANAHIFQSFGLQSMATLVATLPV